MDSFHMGSARVGIVASLALASVLVVVVGSCSPDNPTFTGVDAQSLPGTATLMVSKNGTATGAVSSTPGGIACGTACSDIYPIGTMVTLTVTPDAGAEFAGWSGGGCTARTPTCTVTVDAAKSVTTTFNVAQYPVTINLGGAGTGMVVAPLAGIACPGNCTTMVQHGSQISLNASTATGSLFMGWTVGMGGTACADTGACTTTITGPTMLTATFALYQSLEVMRSGNGNGTVTSSPIGINCGTDCSESYPPGTKVTLTAVAASDSIFMGWSGGGCTGTGTCSVDVSSAVMVTADFRLKQYDLTVSKAGLGAGTVTSAPAGIDCGLSCTATYDAGSMVTVTAAPAAGSLFAGWSGGGCTGTSTCILTMAEATTVTATFNPILYTLTVIRAGAGAGTVTSSPTGINCGTDCTEDYAQGAMVTLTAAPAAGSVFNGWSGGGCSGTGICTVSVTAATSVSADFALAPYELTVTKAGTGTGGVTSSPAGINCSTDCTEPYLNGTMVTLTAAADAGSTFTGWSGGGCMGTGTCAVTITSAISVTATFTLNTYALTVTKTGTGSGTVTSSPAGIDCGADCSETIGHGTVISLTAAPSAGSTFTGWSGACSGTGTCTVTVTDATVVTATFAVPTRTLSVSKSGTGIGTVTSSPVGINCGSTCSATYIYGTSVALTAAPATGSTFTGWSGGGCSGTGTCTVSLIVSTSVTANFGTSGGGGGGGGGGGCSVACLMITP